MVKETKTGEEKKQLKSPEGRMVLIPKVEVSFNTIITSAHNVKSKLLGSPMSSLQVVVAAGETARWKVGDFVQINVDMFPSKPGKTPKHDVGTPARIVIPPLYEIGSTKYLYLNDRHVMWKLKK